MLTWIGSGFLAVGFLTAAFFTVNHTKSISWLYYGLAMGVAFIGLVLVNIARRSAASESEKVAEGIDVVTKGLESLTGKLDELLALRESLDVYAMHEWIDEQLRDDLRDVADARHAVGQRWGLQSYADMMTQFAGSERYVNRAWSASADGYIDEAWLSVEKATGLMHEAKRLVASYHK